MKLVQVHTNELLILIQVLILILRFILALELLCSRRTLLVWCC